MTVKIKHECDDCMYMIEEYRDKILFRYILLDVDEMKQLSKLLSEVGI